MEEEKKIPSVDPCSVGCMVKKIRRSRKVDGEKEENDEEEEEEWEDEKC